MPGARFDLIVRGGLVATADGAAEIEDRGDVVVHEGRVVELPGRGRFVASSPRTVP